MSSSTTRLLLLGTVGLFEPVNGYQIRRELMSWQADRWANLQPGSVYHGLSRLAGDGLLIRHQLRQGSREVSVYQLSASGRAELENLIEAAVRTVDVYDRRDLQAGFALLPMLGHDRAVALISERHQRLAATLPDHPLEIDPSAHPYAPPHALRSTELWSRQAWSEFDWLTDVLDDLRTRRLDLDADWMPPADDPGHQMNAERQRYLTMIAAAAEEE